MYTWIRTRKINPTRISQLWRETFPFIFTHLSKKLIKSFQDFEILTQQWTRILLLAWIIGLMVHCWIWLGPLGKREGAILIFPRWLGSWSALVWAWVDPLYLYYDAYCILNWSFLFAFGLACKFVRFNGAGITTRIGQNDVERGWKHALFSNFERKGNSWKWKCFLWKVESISSSSPKPLKVKPARVK